ncbi:thiopeptide-type bacteriocin biosynthesis protein [Streptomyces boninensis]|uniref:thiopeptide-type bacteriocin biosynthesis protein n=1 Tax=Streptomyces boninensis TaxID=2039455 RepID=UPI003B21EFD2
MIQNRDEDLLPAADRRPPSAWLHFGLEPGAGMLPRTLAGLRTLAADLLADGDVADFFFVRKVPGLRVRFRCAEGRADAVDERVCAVLSRWELDGVVAGWCGGAYEPEEFLFGGPVSMAHVHRVFTADSTAWLGFHALAGSGGGPGPVWAMSLRMIRGLLDGLGIVGWEDLDVWDRLRRQAGRGFAADAELPEAGARAAVALRETWADARRSAAVLHPEAWGLAEAYCQDVAEIAARWREEYFTVGRPAVGPREAAAFVIVFHWNRAGLSAVRQALITSALTVRPRGVDR